MSNKISKNLKTKRNKRQIMASVICIVLVLCMLIPMFAGIF